MNHEAKLKEARKASDYTQKTGLMNTLYKNPPTNWEMNQKQLLVAMLLDLIKNFQLLTFNVPYT